LCAKSEGPEFPTAQLRSGSSTAGSYRFIWWTPRRQRRTKAIVTVAYGPEKKQYVAYWLDTFGPAYSAVGWGTRRGDKVEFTFKYDDGPFYNTFSWDGMSHQWTFSDGEYRKRWPTDILCSRYVVSATLVVATE
jgi:hypothetical protein